MAKLTAADTFVFVDGQRTVVITTVGWLVHRR